MVPEECRAFAQNERSNEKATVPLEKFTDWPTVDLNTLLSEFVFIIPAARIEVVGLDDEIPEVR